MFGNGSDIGIKLTYLIQTKPQGIGEAFMIAEKFIKKANVALILGDNVFYGGGLPKQLKKCVRKVKENQTAIVFGYYVNDPERYGVPEFDQNGTIISVEEKPEKPKSRYAITGILKFSFIVFIISK